MATDLFGRMAQPQKAARFGRRVHLPASARARAEEMRRDGASLGTIAAALGVSVACLRSRLRVELERALPGGCRQGRPRWEPTVDDRATVALLAAERVALERIAEAVGVSPPTLRRRCAAELAHGRGLRGANAVQASEDARAPVAPIASGAKP